ncbi:MAG: DEAD/DEAH box helicase [bacterium]|nr:DEAD/DEAH box helicase [bacterium]
MNLNELVKYGLPQRMIDVWKQRQGDRLLPVQSRAINHGLLGDTLSTGLAGSMIVSAPTSSGKSFCAELAAINVLTRRSKAVLLCPMKSLAEEKYRLFQQTYGPLGIKCLIATGDHPENDESFANGNYHLAVAINEKMDLLLTHHLDVLRNIGLVVIDEIQMIAEPVRGAVLERTLTKILASEYKPTLLALSAVLAERSIQPLADWLSATLVEETVRPRDLIRGVAAEGKLCFRSYNLGHEGEEPFEGLSPQDDDTLASFVKRIKADSGATLVFLKSRADAVRVALKLATAVNWGPAKQAIAQLADEEPSSLLCSLNRTLSRGVAFHSSDLSVSQRKAVEQAFINGEVQVLCSTTTLALGVNLPADTVYLETVKYTGGTYGHRAELVPISRAEFDNMSGRAGRFGFGDDRPGKAIVMADSTFDQEVLWDTYIRSVPPRPIESALDTLPLEDWLLHLFVSGLAGSRSEAARLMAGTFAGKLGLEFSADSLKTAIDGLEDHRMVTADGREGGLVATPCGEATARSGLLVREAAHYLGLVDNLNPETVFGWTCLALSSDHWTLPPSILSWYEQANNLAVKQLYQRFDYSVEEATCLLPESHRREPLSYRQAAALKAALLMDEWCRLVPVAKLEERYRLHLGQIQSLGETAAHLVSALGTLVRATDHDSPAVPQLVRHAFSLRRGLPVSFRQLHRHLGSVLNRSDFAALYQAGIEGSEDFAALSSEDIDRVVGDAGKVKKINEIMQNLKEEVDMRSATLDTTMKMGGQPRLVEIDGRFESDRYLVRIDGFPVRLTGKSFKYLTKLAWSRLNGDTGWIYKEDIEIGFNQARYLYRMKNEINAGMSTNWPVVENNRLGYYRLDINPDGIRFNLDNLKDHPDYELRSIFESRGEAGAVN